MGDILPFVARVRDAGDWTASERARLEALADQFTQAGVHVEVIYGATDDGDPWCVVKDANEDVLVHVARIGGRFVVHFAAQDTFEEGADLPSALGARLADVHLDPDHHDEVVVPFSLAGRQAQGLLALIAATAFFYDTRDAHAAASVEHDPAPAPEEAAVAAVVAALPLAPHDKSERDASAHAAVLTDPKPEPAAAGHTEAVEQPAPEPTPLIKASSEGVHAGPTPTESKPEPTPTPPGAHANLVEAEAPHTLSGSAGNDLLVGGSGADLIVGGAGNDTLQGGGAGHGQFDTLMGGAGDDRIELGPQVMASGGQGADTFVFHVPAHMGGASTLLGVILDFRASEGDRFVNDHGGPVTLTNGRPAPPPEGFNFTAVARQDPQGPGSHGPETLSTPVTWTRMDVDLDGDGKVDGYVMLPDGHGGVVTNMVYTEPGHDGATQTLVTVGHDLSYSKFADV